jgi:hypothetical protein
MLRQGRGQRHRSTPGERGLRDINSRMLKPATPSYLFVPRGQLIFGPSVPEGQVMTPQSEMVQSATTLRAYVRTLPHLLFNAFTFTSAVVSLSIIVSLLDSTSEQINTMLTSQNAAALRLWNNLEYYEHNKADSPSPLPPGLVNELVEFSRTSANIRKVSHRLMLEHILGTDRSDDEGLAKREDVDPRTLNRDGIKDEVIRQIQLYQQHRAQAQDMAALDKTYVTAASTYILPCLYALLGAFLYTGRSRMNGNHQKGPTEHNDRYAMAFVLGATISLFSSLIPKDVLLPPLAVAFLAGYSIDAFTARLDAVVEKMKPRLAGGSRSARTALIESGGDQRA